MLSQFFILSSRGDSIINKDFRGDVTINNIHETFFRKVKEEDPRNDVILMIENVAFIFIRINNLFMVFTTRHNVSPSATIELLNRLAQIFKDYCGLLNEESIRKNFILIYEVLDEIIDFGYPQITSSEALRNYIVNEPVIVSETNIVSSVLKGFNSHSKSAGVAPSSTLMNRGKYQKNEVYVDIIEKLTVALSSTGSIINSSIDGSIQMRSFLFGNPELRLTLNEDLVIGKDINRHGSVVLDDCNFHECVQLNEFENSRTLHFFPPEGSEFVVCNYRITGVDFTIPFRIFPSLKETNSPFKYELSCFIKCELTSENCGLNFQVEIPLPRSTQIAKGQCDTAGCTIEYKESEKKIFFSMNKFPGNSEMHLRVTVSLDSSILPNMAISKREIGPIDIKFDINQYSTSNLQVKYLKIVESSRNYNPFRWVRYQTKSSSYTCRVLN